MRYSIQKYKNKLIETLNSNNLNREIQILFENIFSAWKNRIKFLFVEMVVVQEMQFILQTIIYMELEFLIIRD